MSITGFAKAEAAWENANPFDDECICDGEEDQDCATHGVCTGCYDRSCKDCDDYNPFED